MINHEEIKIDMQRITKVELFINKYNWEQINFPLKREDWKKSEKNNTTRKNVSCLCFKT